MQWFANNSVDEDLGEASETEYCANDQKSCCHENVEIKSTECDTEEDSCCHGGTSPDKKRGVLARILHFSFIQLPRDLTGSLLLGVLVAGVISALVPVDLLKPYLGYGLVPIFVMMVLGIPLYVCATASGTVGDRISARRCLARRGVGLFDCRTGDKRRDDRDSLADYR